MMTVYGPHRDDEKLKFLQEMCSIRAGHDSPCLICGDFNLLYKVEDKSNDRLNQCIMLVFQRCL
jgi:exonuclease III